jgi:hypothetical protein
MTFVILTSKPGQYQTEMVEGLVAAESYEYKFYERTLARFDIVQLVEDVRIKLVDAQDPAQVNFVPSKFLEKFVSVEDARAALRILVKTDSKDVYLMPVHPTEHRPTST